VGKSAKSAKGDDVLVPASIGHFHNENGGIGMIGVAVIAFDNDLRSKNQIKDGYDAAAAALNQAIVDHFPKFGFADVSDEERKEIEKKVRAAIKAGLSCRQQVPHPHTEETRRWRCLHQRVV
jgi:hypothetical protein